MAHKLLYTPVVSFADDRYIAGILLVNYSHVYPLLKHNPEHLLQLVDNTTRHKKTICNYLQKYQEVISNTCLFRYVDLQQ